MPNFNKFLREDEEVIAAVPRFWIMYFWSGLLTVIIFLLPFFLVFLLFRWQTAGLVIFSFLVLLGLILLFRLISNYRHTQLLITNQRLVILDQKGWWHQTVQPIGYQQIHDVTYSREGAWEQIFNFGNLQLRIMTGNIIIKDIKKPKIWQETITNLKNFYTTTPLEQWDKSMLLEAIKKIQDKLGGEVFQRLLK